MNRLVATWLQTLKEFEDYSEKFLLKVIKVLEVVDIKDKFCKILLLKKKINYFFQW